MCSFCCFHDRRVGKPISYEPKVFDIESTLFCYKKFFGRLVFASVVVRAFDAVLVVANSSKCFLYFRYYTRHSFFQLQQNIFNDK